MNRDRFLSESRRPSATTAGHSLKVNSVAKVSVLGETLPSRRGVPGSRGRRTAASQVSDEQQARKTTSSSCEATNDCMPRCSSVEVRSVRATPKCTDKKSNPAPRMELSYSPPCPQVLQRMRLRPRNISPFDTKMFHPMLPPPSPSVSHCILVALDLDETLIHSTLVSKNSEEKPHPETYTFAFDFSRASSDERQEIVYVAVRPHVETFIDFLASHFEVVVFTASSKAYADAILDKLDPDRKLGCHRLYREHCAEVGGVKVKDLSLLGRPLNRVVLIDNTPTSFCFQPRNGIPISSWYDDTEDSELLRLLPTLHALTHIEDVVDVVDAHHAALLSATGRFLKR